MGYLNNIILQQFEFQNKKGGQPKKNLVIVLSNS